MEYIIQGHVPQFPSIQIRSTAIRLHLQQGVYYAIYNSGAVTSAININSNNIGNSTTGAFTFSAANSGAQIFINNTAGAATAALSISNNNFQGVTYSVAGSGANTYISKLSSNTFTGYQR